MNIHNGFETIQSKSKVLTVSSIAALLLSEALNAHAFFGELFGFFTKLGILGRATGWMGKKLTQHKK